VQPDTLQAPAQLPTRAALSKDALHLMLRTIDPVELREPFMQQTVDRLPGDEQIVSFPFEQLDRLPAYPPPTGVIFHVARCGSTLVSQLLKQQPGVVVYAEPLPINEILVPPHRAPRAQLVSALRCVGALLARHANGPYIIKCTSWNSLYCDLVTEAFLDTTWIMCVRDPLEVAVSLLHERPGWLRGPGESDPFASRIDPTRVSRSPEEYVAHLLAAYCDAAARLDAARGRVVDYERLPDAVWSTVAPHFGLSPDSQVRQRMAVLSRMQSKSAPGKSVPFVQDSAAKRAAASPALESAISEITRPALQRLHVACSSTRA
jgi:hypothetical protein